MRELAKAAVRELRISAVHFAITGLRPPPHRWPYPWSLVQRQRPWLRFDLRCELAAAELSHLWGI